MSRLQQHLDHIRTDVVPGRAAAHGGLDAAYVREIEARPQPPHLVRGLEQWNSGRFYDQHETLEWLWRATSDPVRDALKGIIQSGVGAYHILNHNRHGALAKWTGAIGYLEPFDTIHPYGIDTGDLRRQIAAARQALLDDDVPVWANHEVRARTMRVAWEPRIAEPRVTALLRRVDRAWQESHLSLEEAIKGLAEEEAEWSPAEGVPSIRSQLEALGKRKATTASYCFADRPLEWEDLRPPAEWRLFLRWLTEQHEAVREPLGFLSDHHLSKLCRVASDDATPLELVVEAIIEKDLHAAGRINMLRSLHNQTH